MLLIEHYKKLKEYFYIKRSDILFEEYIYKKTKYTKKYVPPKVVFSQIFKYKFLNFSDIFKTKEEFIENSLINLNKSIEEFYNDLNFVIQKYGKESLIDFNCKLFHKIKYDFCFPELYMNMCKTFSTKEGSYIKYQTYFKVNKVPKEIIAYNRNSFYDGVWHTKY